MELFYSNKLILTWLCIHPPAEETNRIRRLAYVAFTILVFMISFLGWLDSAIFVYRFIDTNLEAALFGILQFIAMTNVVYLTIIAYILRPKLVEVIQKFTLNYRLCEIS